MCGNNDNPNTCWGLSPARRSSCTILIAKPPDRAATPTREGLREEELSVLDNCFCHDSDDNNNNYHNN